MEKKYCGVVCNSNKVFGAVVEAYQHAQKADTYSADGQQLSLLDIQSGKLKSVTMVDDKVTGFKVANKGIIAEMSIINNHLVAVHMKSKVA